MAYGTLAQTGLERFSVGDVGFIVDHAGDRDEHTTISREPSHTNIAMKNPGEPRLTGWLGSTNNVSSTAAGLGRVVSVDSDREGVVRYVPLADSKVAAALKALGFPDLAN